MDPYDNGRINYEQFLNGIEQMISLQNGTTTNKKHGDANKINYEPDRNSNGVSVLFLF